MKFFAPLLAAFAVIASFQPTAATAADAAPAIGLKLIAEGFSAPSVLVSIPDGSGRLLVADQAGVIYLIDRDGKRAEQPFVDLREKLSTLGKGMEERGLLGLALHPQFKSNRKFYVVYSAPRRAEAPPQWDHAERLSEFQTVADFSRAVLISVCIRPGETR